MKTKGVFVLFFIVGLAAVAFAQQRSTSGAIDQRFEKADRWLHEKNLSVTRSPEEALVNEYILASGEGVPAATAATAGEKRITAERAATVLAYRALGEMLEGVSLVGDTKVKNASLEYDAVRAAVTGFIKGAQIVYQEYNEGQEVALVMVKVGMTGPQSFGQLMYDKILNDQKIKENLAPPAPEFKAPPAPPPDESYDGLIIDARTENFRPALLNRVFAEKGEVLYDPLKVDQKILVEQGCGEYTNSVAKARAALESRGVKNPLVVKATGTMSPCDVKLSDNDAVKVFSADQKAGFLATGKVAFVLK